MSPPELRKDAGSGSCKMSEHPEHTPPAAVTREIFHAWRSPRRGSANPERMNNPLWEWLIECRLNAYQANNTFNGPSPFDAGPMWCFDRFGQSVTQLADGRTVLIGGEHEDYYDPDFYIYNDVVVKQADGRVEIYGYPHDIFAPTDFHSATLAGNRIILIGNLGYPEDRRLDQTQVLALDCDTWSVARLDAVGPSPGWLHRHNAELQADGASIRVSGGQLFRGPDASLVENIDDWLLHLDGWRWQRLTQRRWVRFEVHREDRGRNHLFEMRSALFDRKMGWQDDNSLAQRPQSQLGSPSQLDLLSLLYVPSVPHEVIPQQEDEYNVYRIRVDGVVVRYVEESYTVQATIEGDLPADSIQHLRKDLIRKLELIEQSPMACEAIV